MPALRPIHFVLYWLLTFTLLSSFYLLLSGGHVAVVNDLPQDYASARAWCDGVNAYESLVILQPRYGMELPDPNLLIDSNLHPPVAILLTVPYAWLEFQPALVAIQWTQLAVLSLVWMLCFVMFRPPVPVWVWASAGGLFGLWSPVWQGVIWGQPIGLLALATLGIWVLARTEKPFAFGVVLAAASLVRPFYAVHIVQLCGWNRRQQLMAVAGLLVGGLVPFALLETSPWEWYRTRQVASGYSPMVGSVPGLLDLGGPSAQLLYAGAAIVLGALRWRGMSADATAALAATLSLLVYPLPWYFYDPSLLPVVAWVVWQVGLTGNRLASWCLLGYLVVRTIPNLMLQPEERAFADFLARNQPAFQVFSRALLLLAVVSVARNPARVSENGPS